MQLAMPTKSHHPASFAVFAALAIGIGLSAGYMLESRHRHTAAPLDLSWSVLEDGYRAAAKKDDSWLYEDTLKQLKSITGENVSLFGYMLPLEAAETHHHFLFSPRNHSCPFCMPANAGNLIEVFTDDGMPYRNEAFKLEGAFDMQDNEHSPLIYRMEHAHPTENR
jgi:hypothetical protein